MAATISAAANETIMRLTFRDYFDEEVVKTTVLDGAVDDTTLELMFDHMDALSNAQIVGAKVSASRTVTGLKAAAVNALERNVSNQLIISFSKANPVNALAPDVVRSFIIPAFVSGVQNQDTSINYDLTPVGTTAPERLGDLINNLADNLMYVGADGLFYPGDWLFDVPASGFGTAPNVIDGQ